VGNEVMGSEVGGLYVHVSRSEYGVGVY
jgi:hypothetical protein